MSRTRERDEQAAAVALANGWIPIRLWECSIREDPDACVDRIMCAATDGALGFQDTQVPATVRQHRNAG